jgi:hypothetical protein
MLRDGSEYAARFLLNFFRVKLGYVCKIGGQLTQSLDKKRTFLKVRFLSILNLQTQTKPALSRIFFTLPILCALKQL